MGDDIFKLLLVLLLVIDRDSDCNNSTFSTLNTIIILALLFRSDEIGGTSTTSTPTPPTLGLFPTNT